MTGDLVPLGAGEMQAALDLDSEQGPGRGCDCEHPAGAGGEQVALTASPVARGEPRGLGDFRIACTPSSRGSGPWAAAPAEEGWWTAGLPPGTLSAGASVVSFLALLLPSSPAVPPKARFSSAMPSPLQGAGDTGSGSADLGRSRGDPEGTQASDDSLPVSGGTGE